MPTKDDPRITVRLPQAVYDELKGHAERRDVTVGHLVRGLISLGLSPEATRAFAEAAAIDKAFREIPGNGPTIMGPPALHCPVSDCNYTALSPKARCPHHNRLVV